MIQTVERDDRPEDYRSIDEDVVDVIDRNIGKENVGYGIAGDLGGVASGQIVGVKTSAKKEQGKDEGENKIGFPEGQEVSFL